MIDDLEAKEMKDKDDFHMNDTMQSKGTTKQTGSNAFKNRRGNIKVNETSSSDEEDDEKYKFSFIPSEKIKEHQS